MKKLIYLLLFLIFIPHVFAVEKTEFEKAFQEVEWAYYMRRENIQYNSQRTNTTQGYYPPEDATSQNRNYSVCSGFPKYVYRNMFGIVTPPYTSSSLSYAKSNIGTSGNVERKEIVAFGEQNDNGDLVFRIQNKNGQVYDTLTNPTITDIIPYLKIGDVLTYTGHSITIYDLVYDDQGNVTNAIVMESGHGKDGIYIKTKIPTSLNITNSADKVVEFHSSANQYFYSNTGTLNFISKLVSNETVWGNLTAAKNKKRQYSILRFVTTNENGQMVLNYIDKLTQSETITYTDKVVTLETSAQNRLNHSKLYIEKTVDVWNGSKVEEGDKLTYSIKVKNASDENYTTDIIVKENLSEYVTYVSSDKNPTINNQELSWNIGKLNKDQEIIINYTVRVKRGTFGKTIVNTGTVGGIPNSYVSNEVRNNLSDEEKTKIVNAYNSLKDTYSGKELIDKIYQNALSQNLELTNFKVTDLIKDTNPATTSFTTVSLDKDNAMYKMILNNYWSTLYHKEHTLKSNQKITEYYMYNLKPYSDSARREDTVYHDNFETGDILIYNNTNDVLYTYNSSNYTATTTNVTLENGEYAYIFIEGTGFVGINYKGEDAERNSFDASYYTNHSLPLYSNGSTPTDFANYQTLLAKDNYVVLRPSLLKNEADPAPLYEITEGSNQEFELESSNSLSFKSSGSNDLIENVSVDGNIIPESNYELGTNNTITLKNDYLNNLTAGEHTLVVNYYDGGKASTAFSVKQKTVEELPHEEDYEITEGSNQKFELGSDKTLSFKSSGSNDLIKTIMIDEKNISEEGYVLGVGNTITLTNEYLNNLTVGEHSLVISYSNGKTVTTTFVVNAKPDVPNTGAFLSIGFIISLFVLFIGVNLYKNRFNKLHKI